MHEKKFQSITSNQIAKCKPHTAQLGSQYVTHSMYVIHSFLLTQKGRGWLTSSLLNWKITLGKGVLQQGGIRNEVTVSQKKVNVKQRILQFT